MDLARDGRFEEAAEVRDRYRALGRTLERRRTWTALQQAGSIIAAGPDGSGALIEPGRLVAAWEQGDQSPLLAPAAATEPIATIPLDGVDAAEAALVWKWLGSPGVRLLDIAGSLSLPCHPVEMLERIAV